MILHHEKNVATFLTHVSAPQGEDEDVQQEEVTEQVQKDEEATLFQMLLVLRKGDDLGEGKRNVDAHHDHRIQDRQTGYKACDEAHG